MSHPKAALVAIGLLLAACTGDGATETTPIGSSTPAGQPSASTGPAEVGTVTLTMTGCELTQAADVVPAGPIAIAVVNETDVLGWLNVARLDDGSRFEDLQAYVAEEVKLAKAGEPGLGHPSYAVPVSDVVVDPGGSGSLEATLTAGAHAIACGRFYPEAGDLRPTDVLQLEVAAG